MPLRRVLWRTWHSLFGLLKRALSVNVTSMENYDATKLPDEEIVVFVVSTTWDGDVLAFMPDFEAPSETLIEHESQFGGSGSVGTG